MTAPLLTLRQTCLLAASIVLAAQSGHLLFAQEMSGTIVMGPTGDQPAAAPSSSGGYGASAPPTASPAEPKSSESPPHGPRGKAGEADKSGGSPGKSGEGAKANEAPKPLKRSDKPDTPPDPKELLKAVPDKNNKFKFTFNGQAWLPVLQWLADHSNMSLEWQELPSDYVNLRMTQQSYTIREVRDQINRRLLDRGYTLLCDGESLTVVNVNKLNSALVPRVGPENLDRRDLYEFVKVSFPLTCLTAETAARELAPMKSSYGKLTPMVDANCVEAMDTVVNLREMCAVLKQEQSVENQQRSVRKFKLDYASADDVREELQTLVGGESKSPAKPQSPEQAQQAAMMARMQQQQGGQQGGQPGQTPAAPAGPKMGVAFAVNHRENSILVTAPPDKMAIVVQVIAAIDVRTDRDRSLAGAMNRMQVYRLAGIDPEPVVKTLEEIGNLSPTHHLEVDKKNKAIIAYASLADHVTIRAVVDKLSGSDRTFEVIRLRRLRADSVAGSIEFMMGLDPKKKKKETHRYWSPWDDYSSSNAKEKANEFRVDADVEHNRLLLWANEIELGEVQTLLAKLGEVPPKGSNNKAMRVIDAGSPQETSELLDRIREQWPGPNPLSLPSPGSNRGKAEASPRDAMPEAELPSKTTAAPPAGTILRLAELRRDAPTGEAVDNRDETGRKTPPPVDVRVGPDGKLVISSQDAQALDLFEELIAQLATPDKNYRVFRLKCASAFSVSLNLEDFFKDEPKKQVRRPWYFYDYDDQDDSATDDRGLSKRPKVKFISDPDTNSILVTGADAAQLKTIEDLVNLYDKPPPSDSQSVRKTEIIYLRHSKAKAVADTVKDVYRDLLSENDKALANQNQSQRGERRGFSFDFGFDDNGKNEQKIPKFKGLLSIGIDEASNSLVVSVPAYLFDHVSKMIKDLDEAAAANNAVRVLRVGHGVTADRLREIIDALQGQGSHGSTPSGATPPHQAGSRRGSKPAANGGTPAARASNGD